MTMPRMDKADLVALQNLDLKTLIFLGRLLETGSVTRTAEATGMSQPAASRAIERLRKAIEDPLLVRTRKGYVLTARAVALQPLVATAIASMARVFEKEVFDPARTRRTFRIASTDYGAVAVVTPMMIQMAVAAPNAIIDITKWTGDALDRLENGKCDLALYADDDLPPDFHYRELYRDSYALVMRQGHPALASSPVDLPDFMSVLSVLKASPRAVIMYPEGHQLLPDDILAKFTMGGSEAVLRTPYFMSMPWAIAQTDLVLCVPVQIARRMVEISGLVSIAAPQAVEPFGYRMIWHERVHRDTAQIWLRSLIFDVCRPLRLAIRQGGS